MIVYLKNMVGYKIAHFKGMTYDQVRPIFEREYNNVQTFLKSDRDEPTKKKVAKETLLQESFKKLRAEVEVAEALQVKYPAINWEIYSKGSKTYWKIIRVGGITQAYRSFEDMGVEDPFQRDSQYPVLKYALHLESTDHHLRFHQFEQTNHFDHYDRFDQLDHFG
nr:hypothetical protein [Tanacetum cinerariifolium]